MTDQLSPSMGHIKNGLHYFPVRVYYEDTDAGGIVYHARYLHFLERGRTEMLRLCGFEHFAMMTTQTSPTLLVVKKMSIDFVDAAALDDELVIKTKITRLGAATILMEQEALCDGNIILTATLKIGVLGADKRPKKMTKDMVDKLKTCLVN